MPRGAGTSVSEGERAAGVGGAAGYSRASATGAETDGSDRRTRAVATRRAHRALKAQRAAERSRLEVVADELTRRAASAGFLLLHAGWFAVWILWNVGALGLRPFDPYPFGLLTMIVSLEAIFLAIFVLMSQSRESSIAELREEITLQVLLRSEEEVTKTLQLVAGLYGRLGKQIGEDPELQEMLRPLDAERIERDLVTQIGRADGAGKAVLRRRRPSGARGEDSAR